MWSEPFGDTYVSYGTMGYSCDVPRMTNRLSSWVSRTTTYVTTEFRK